MECKFCKLNVMTIVLNVLLVMSLIANVWLLQKLDSVYHNNADNNTWVTPRELELIKEEIKRLETANK